MRWLSLPRSREHVVDPARSRRFSRMDHGVMKQLAVGIFLAVDVSPFPRREGRIQQDICVSIVSKQIGVAMEPLTALDSELGKRGFAFAVYQRGGFVDQLLGLCGSF